MVALTSWGLSERLHFSSSPSLCRRDIELGLEAAEMMVTQRPVAFGILVPQLLC